MLSVYSLIKPPKFGNCTVSEKKIETMISVTDIKQAYGESESRSAEAIDNLRQKLDEIINYYDYDVDEVIKHDYSLAPVQQCIIYYVTGYSIYLFKNFK